MTARRFNTSIIDLTEKLSVDSSDVEAVKQWAGRLSYMKKRQIRYIDKLLGRPEREYLLNHMKLGPVQGEPVIDHLFPEPEIKETNESSQSPTLRPVASLLPKEDQLVDE
jgi:hypothetical protein